MLLFSCTHRFSSRLNSTSGYLNHNSCNGRKMMVLSWKLIRHWGATNASRSRSMCPRSALSSNVFCCGFCSSVLRQVKEVASQTGLTPAQVLISWHVQRGVRHFSSLWRLFSDQQPSTPDCRSAQKCHALPGHREPQEYVALSSEQSFTS